MFVGIIVKKKEKKLTERYSLVNEMDLFWKVYISRKSHFYKKSLIKCSVKIQSI